MIDGNYLNSKDINLTTTASIATTSIFSPITTEYNTVRICDENQLISLSSRAVAFDGILNFLSDDQLRSIFKNMKESKYRRCSEVISQVVSNRLCSADLIKENIEFLKASDIYKLHSDLLENDPEFETIKLYLALC